MGCSSTCPVCKKRVTPGQPVYTISEQDYHPECYEQQKAGRAKCERGHDRD